MKDKKKGKGKRMKYAIILFVILAIVFGGVFVYFIQRSQQVLFKVNGKELDELAKKITYGTAIDVSPKGIALQAFDWEGEDITNQIDVDKKTYRELGSYQVIYKVKNQRFVMNLTIVDKEAPKIEGPKEMHIEVNQTFSYDPLKLGIKVSDNHDQDLIKKVVYEKSVKTDKVGQYEVVYQVKDQTGNAASYKLIVYVDEKKVVTQTPSNNGNNNKVDPPMTNQKIPFYKQDPRTITYQTIKNPNDLTVLVNKKNAIANGWTPQDLVYITSNNGLDMQLRDAAAQGWEKLNKVAKKKGITIKVVSSYRTQQYQAMLFENYLVNNGSEAYTFSAASRRSEHELGLAIDVSYDGQLHNDLLMSDVGVFMSQEGYRYGFILRYPSDKENTTGYAFEAWHYRYVGVELATYLKQHDLTLEEYYK